MSPPGPCCAIAETFDGRVAARELERYRRKGPRSSTRRLLDALLEAGVDGATLLDVGGGIGAIPAELLGAGASSATVVDASTAFLAAARDERDRRGLDGRLELVHGDFVALCSRIAAADIVTLDRVVCCYPDMEKLLDSSTGRSTHLYGIIYPRDGWWIRLLFAFQNAKRRLRGSAFRAYVFGNRAIDDTIRRAGFSLLGRARGLAWVVALYRRSDVPR